MYRIFAFFSLLAIGIAALEACVTPPEPAVSLEAPIPSGPYLGQDPPGLVGELFAPGVLSTELDELNAVFLPGGREVFY